MMLCLALAPSALAQSAIEHHTWQDRGLYEAISSTAGAIVLWATRPSPSQAAR
jgi:hypothetical protein